MSETSSITRREARALLSETRTLLKRARKSIGDDVKARVESKMDALHDALDDAGRRDLAYKELSEESDRSLSFARKSRAREYAESIAIAVFIALTIRSFVFEPFKIPSPSMVPTLEVGDRIFVAKYAYGIRLPLTTSYLWQWSEFERGDVVVFRFPSEHALTRDRIGMWVERLQNMPVNLPDSLADLEDPTSGQPFAQEQRIDAWGNPLRYEQLEEAPYFLIRSDGPDEEPNTADDIDSVMVEASMGRFPDGRRPNGATRAVRCAVDARHLASSQTYIKRIIGMPGDEVEVRDNRLILNGTPVERELLSADQVETRRGILTARVWRETLPNGVSYRARTLVEDEQFGPIRVPEGHLLMMGDNRDESADGRCWGFVPEDYVKGEARFVLFSAPPGGGFTLNRAFRGLD